MVHSPGIRNTSPSGSWYTANEDGRMGHDVSFALSSVTTLLRYSQSPSCCIFGAGLTSEHLPARRVVHGFLLPSVTTRLRRSRSSSSSCWCNCPFLKKHLARRLVTIAFLASERNRHHASNEPESSALRGSRRGAPCRARPRKIHLVALLVGEHREQRIRRLKRKRKRDDDLGASQAEVDFRVPLVVVPGGDGAKHQVGNLPPRPGHNLHVLPSGTTEGDVASIVPRTDSR
ncbi:hypothetical protein B0H12DRAFT_1229100 [Mycena haematopus]|nr:hypothetical protein B0H12DRAFT_1229100 [Mycena haematopus]